MTDLFLGLIALGVVVMASIQVAGIVAAIGALRRLGEMAGRFEQDLKPVIANLQKVTDDAARVSAQAAAHVERLDALATSLAQRAEETAASVQRTILQPIRDGMAVLNALKNVVAGFREARDARRPEEAGRPAPAEDELFIG